MVHIWSAGADERALRGMLDRQRTGMCNAQ